MNKDKKEEVMIFIAIGVGLFCVATIYGAIFYCILT